MLMQIGIICRFEHIADISTNLTPQFVTPQFIDFIISKETPYKEEFHNIKIHSDNNIATVYFDYIFYDNNKKDNWGE
ncbi:hypothetical protein A3Q33_11615 [Colwellia sp. PAMC 21821]|nr:hypothetical protein A3Q33_11615 [Colwellia sp. PAMC 21821]